MAYKPGDDALLNAVKKNNEVTRFCSQKMHDIGIKQDQLLELHPLLFLLLGRRYGKLNRDWDYYCAVSIRLIEESEKILLIVKEKRRNYDSDNR